MLCHVINTKKEGDHEDLILRFIKMTRMTVVANDATHEHADDHYYSMLLEMYFNFYDDPN